MEFITVLKIVKNEKGNKVWKIIRNDYNVELEGDVTMYGIPENAEDCPIGATYKTIFTIKVH